MIDALTPLLPGFTNLQWLASTGSSNADLMLRARQPAHPPLPWLLGADHQSAARGRAGRVWQNTSGATLMFSCAFAVDLPVSELPGLSPVMGIAACEALRALITEHEGAETPSRSASLLKLKWPNDLLWGQAKLAGILVEATSIPGSSIPIIVVGIGLNLKDAEARSIALNRPIADWSQIADISSVQIVARIAQAWSEAIKIYATERYAAFTKRFDRVDALAGQQIDVKDHETILQTGIAIGTDSIGRLLLQTEQGVSAVMVGDVSIHSAASAAAN